MITEDYVSYEIAKLLKEKGFDEECRAFWKEWNGATTLCHCSSAHAFEWCNNQMLKRYNDDSEMNIATPTPQMAMKWLRDKKHYCIQVMLDSWAYGGHSGYYAVIQKTDSDFEMMLQDAVDEVFYQTYEEAAEAAIKYCLENLI